MLEILTVNPFARFVCIAASAAALAGAGAAEAQPAAGQHPDLGAALHLRPDQQGAYQAFQKATMPPPQAVAQIKGLYSRMVAAHTPERLELMAQIQQMQAANTAHDAQAVRQFYAQLSPEQQRAFDQITAPRGPGGPGQ